MERILESEAVPLFSERAYAADSTFRLSDDNVEAVASLCRHLDGIPLAIELAAARIKTFTVEQLAERVDDRFSLLTGGSRTALPRHRTLRAAIEWSYDLLDQCEQRIFDRLALFAGPFAINAALQVSPLEEARPSYEMTTPKVLPTSAAVARWIASRDRRLAEPG